MAKANRHELESENVCLQDLGMQIDLASFLRVLEVPTFRSRACVQGHDVDSASSPKP